MTKNDSIGAEAPGEPLEIRILRSIRRIIRSVDLESKQLKGEFEITGPQLRLLAQLDAEGRQNPSALARALYLSASTVVGILDRLEEKGWVARERDAVDRRLAWSTITEDGRRLLQAAPSPLQEKLSKGLGELSILERAAIALSLERLVLLLEAEGIDAAPYLESGPIGSSPELPGATPRPRGRTGGDP